MAARARAVDNPGAPRGRTAMSYAYEHLRVDIADRVATVTIDNPPINLITMALFAELSALSSALEADRDISVVVLKSADPDFFLAHFDVSAILQFPVDAPARKRPEIGPYHAMCQRFRTMDKVTIAQIEGRVGGGGSELAANCDMRFGVRGRTIANQMEVPLGILPGGTGTQMLPRLVGRARAMEIIMGGGDLDAETAERWGYLNRIFDAAEIGPWVADFARRIAAAPAETIRLAKVAVEAAAQPLAAGFLDEAHAFDLSLRIPEARALMARFLELGGQTRDGELNLPDLIARLRQT